MKVKGSITVDGVHHNAEGNGSIVFGMFLLVIVSRIFNSSLIGHFNFNNNLFN